MPAHHEDYDPRFADDDTGPLARWIDWLILAVTGMMLGISVYQLGGYLPFGKPLVVVTSLGGLLLVLHGLSWMTRRDRPAVHPHAWLALPFLVWAAARTWFGNPSPWLGELQLLTFFAASGVWWTVLHHYRQGSKLWILLGIAVLTGAGTFGVALYQTWVDPTWLPLDRVQARQYWIMGRVSGTFGVPNNFASYLAVLFPLLVLVAAARRFRPVVRVLSGVLALAMLEGVFLSISRGAYLSLAPVLAALPIFVLRRPLYQIAGTVVFLVILAGGAAWVYTHFDHVRDRIEDLQRYGGESTRKYKWRAAVDMIRDKPLLGHGLGSYEFILDAYSPPGFGYAPRYAHNEYLNTLSDLGWPGFILLFGPAGFLWAASLRRWWRTPALAIPPDNGPRVTPQAKILCGWLVLAGVAFGLHCVVDFHLKLPANLLLITLVFAAGTRHLTRRRWHFRDVTAARLLLAVGPILLGSVTAYRGAVVGLGTHSFFRAHEQLNAYLEDPSAPGFDETFLERVRRGFERTLHYLPDHAEARARLGVTHLYLARFRPAERETRARLALDEIDAALSQAVHWRFHVYRALALAQLRRPVNEILSAAENAVSAAPNQPDAWYYLAVVASQIPSHTDRAREAVARVLELDPEHVPAQGLAERLAPKPADEPPQS